MQDNLKKAQDKVTEGAETVKDKLSEDFKKASPKIEDTILTAKEKMPKVTPTPSGFKPQSSANDLKSRLEWGEPAFTILDVRDREAFNQGHITGAMPMPMEELVDRAKPALDLNRDIYVYADSDDQTAQAANQLRGAGFENVAELRGGLAAWKAIGGPTDGSVESMSAPSPGAYNVASRIAESAGDK